MNTGKPSESSGSSLCEALLRDAIARVLGRVALWGTVRARIPRVARVSLGGTVRLERLAELLADYGLPGDVLRGALDAASLLETVRRRVAADASVRNSLDVRRTPPGTLPEQGHNGRVRMIGHVVPVRRRRGKRPARLPSARKRGATRASVAPWPLVSRRRAPTTCT